VTTRISLNAASHWNRVDNSGRVNWWSSEKCQAYYNAAVCGEPVTGSSEGCRRRLRQLYPDRVFRNAVSVGCGEGSKELALLADGLVESFDLWEISEKRAATGTANLERMGLADRARYRVGDAFAAERTPAYDLVYWDHSLHHMSDVDDALAWSAAILRPGGVVLINDYVGPNRLQWRRFEVDRANAFLRRALISSGVDVRMVRHSDLLSRLRMWRRDPSEAPQSEKIEQAVERRLPGLRLQGIGGTFLNILGGVVVPAAADDHPAIDSLLAEDAKLREEGSSHFAFGIWEKA